MKSIYFLGIGGIGMSALALYYKNKGVHVSGYDKSASVVTERLQQKNIEVFFIDDISHIPQDIDFAVYTPAVPPTLKEMQYIKEKGIPLYKRSEVLGFISKESNCCIAVAGTHGKTTTTALTAHLLATQQTPTAFIGGIAKNFNSNFVTATTADKVVVEADEYDRSLLTLNPDIAILLSIDADHLDIYKDRADLTHTFAQFLNKVKVGGKRLVHHALKDEIAPLIDTKDCLFFDINNPKADYFADNIRILHGKYTFDLHLYGGEIIPDISLQSPGLHNINNSVAAAAAAHLCSISAENIRQGISSFSGVKRRFDFIAQTPHCVFIDDYAHHPTEIKATIAAARDFFPTKKLTGIFQPHLYSRTRDLIDDFATALSGLDEVILLPIYPARELPIEGVTSEWLLSKIKSTHKQCCSKETLPNLIQQQKPEVLLTIGAGDIELLLPQLKAVVNTL